MRQRRLVAVFGHQPWPALFAVSAFGLAASTAGVYQAEIPVFCSSLGALEPQRWRAAIEATIAMTSPMMLAADWAVMLLAMMPPLLAMPIMHVWRSSTSGTRSWLTALFLIAYALIWIGVGPAMLALAVLVKLALGQLAFPAGFALAVAWSSTPWQRTALNRSHRLRRISLFGRDAAADAFWFGVTHGGWCIASCWAWMLLPFLSEGWHLLVMLVTGAVMLAERLSPSSTPRWHVPLPLGMLPAELKHPFQRHPYP